MATEKDAEIHALLLEILEEVRAMRAKAEATSEQPRSRKALAREPAPSSSELRMWNIEREVPSFEELPRKPRYWQTRARKLRRLPALTPALAEAVELMVESGAILDSLAREPRRKKSQRASRGRGSRPCAKARRAD